MEDSKADKKPEPEIKVWPLDNTDERKATEEELKQQELDSMVKQMMDLFQDKKYKAEYLQL